MKTAHSQEFVEAMLVLAPLLRKHQPLKDLGFIEICDWVAHYWNRGTISYLIDDDGEPRAVCLMKYFRNIRQFLEPHVHEPCGRMCMIELLVASEPVSMAAVCREQIARFGPQHVVMFDRGERTENGAPRMYIWSKFMTLVRRLTYGSL
jgi:hypothetical protein